MAFRHIRRNRNPYRRGSHEQLPVRAISFQDVETRVQEDFRAIPSPGTSNEILVGIYRSYKKGVKLVSELYSLAVKYSYRIQIRAILKFMCVRLTELRHEIHVDCCLHDADHDWEAFISPVDPVSRHRALHLLEHFGGHKTACYLSSVPNPLEMKMTRDEAIAIIMRNELGRQGVIEGDRLRRERKKLDAISQPPPQITPSEAATRIASAFRAYKCRKEYLELRDYEYEFIDCGFGAWSPDERARSAEEFRILQAMADENERSWLQEREVKRERLRAEIRHELTSALDECRAKIWQFREKYLKFPVSIEELLAPPPIEKPAPKKPPTKEKKSREPQKPIEPPTRDLLKKMLEDLAYDEYIPHINQDDMIYIRSEITEEVMRTLNFELEALKLRSGQPIDPVPQDLPETASIYDEQDLIDLIKLGIVKRIEPAHIKDFLADPYIGEQRVAGSLKSIAVEDCIVPLTCATTTEHIRSLLLYGLPGYGMSMTARAIATESNAMWIDLTHRLVAETGLSLADLFDKVLRIARHHAPTVIYIDEMHTWVDVDKTKKLKRHDIGLKDLEELIQKCKGERIQVIATSASPTLRKAQADLFDIKVFIGSPEKRQYGAFIYRYMEKRMITNIDRTFVRSLASITAGIPFVNVVRMMDFMLTKHRIGELPRRPLKSCEFIDVLSRFQTDIDPRYADLEKRIKGLIAEPPTVTDKSHARKQERK